MTGRLALLETDEASRKVQIFLAKVSTAIQCHASSELAGK